MSQLKDVPPNMSLIRESVRKIKYIAEMQILPKTCSDIFLGKNGFFSRIVYLIV
jgi:hypothetical protein